MSYRHLDTYFKTILDYAIATLLYIGLFSIIYLGYNNI